MKVLLISTNADQAGAPIHVETLVTGLGQLVDFHIVFGEVGPVQERLSASGVKSTIIPQLRSKINPVLDFITLVKFLLIIIKFKPDLIHAHSTKAGMIARISSLLTFVPCIYTVHGWGWRGLGRFSSMIVYFIEKLLSKTPRTRFIYVAKHVEKEASNLLKIPEHKGCVIFNGSFDIGICPATTNDEIRIIMLARVSPAKDHESLVRAFNLFDARSKLVLCGSGTADFDFIEILKVWAPEAHHRIQTLGQRSDVADLLHQSNAFALISHFEALPMSIIEAMSAGLPIIATDVGGVSELILDEFNGCLVERGNVAQILEALNRVSEPKFSAELGLNARMTYEAHFASKSMINNTYGIYCEVTGN